MENTRTTLAIALAACVSSAFASLVVQDLGGESVDGVSLIDYEGKEIRNGNLTFSANQSDVTNAEFAVGSGATVTFNGNFLPNSANGTFTVKQGGKLVTGPNSKCYVTYSKPGTNRLVVDGGTAEFNGNFTSTGNYPLGIPCVFKKGSLDGLTAVLHVINGGTVKTTVEGANLVMGFGSDNSYTYSWRNINGELVVSNGTLSVRGQIFPAGHKNNTSYTGRNYVLFKDAVVTCRQIYVYQYPKDVTVEFDNATIRWAGQNTSFIGRNSKAKAKPYTILAGGLKLDIPAGQSLTIDANAAPLPGVGGVTKIGGGSLTWSNSGSMEFTGPMTVAGGKFTSSLAFAASAFAVDGASSELALSGAMSHAAPALSAANGGKLTLAGATVPSAATLSLASGGTTDFFTRDGATGTYSLGALSLGPSAVLDLDTDATGCDTLALAAPASVTATAESRATIRFCGEGLDLVPSGTKYTLFAYSGGDVSPFMPAGLPGEFSVENGMLVFTVVRGAALYVI